MKKTLSKAGGATRATDQIRPYSSLVLDGPDRAPNRSMLPRRFRGRRISRSRSSASPPPGAWSRRATCTSTSWPGRPRRAPNAAGGKAIIFGTITVSDGICMGTPGMRYSLVSREVIADSIETVVGAEGFDGLVAIGGCDKNMPGCIMAMARLNRPAVFVYGGTILPGCIPAKQELRHRLGVRGGGRARGRQARRRATAGDRVVRDSRARAPAAACTRPTPWPRPSRRWA